MDGGVYYHSMFHHEGRVINPLDGESNKMVFKHVGMFADPGAAGADPEGGGVHLFAAAGQRPSVPPLLAPPLSRHLVCRG